MKRFVSVILVIITLSLCILPCNAETISVISEDDYIYVTYEEFHGNRAYYDTLLLEGYTICVYVGEEYADAEIARLTQPVETLHTLVPSSHARGTSVPTAKYDVHETPSYHFTCDAKYEMLYTNVKFYGCTTYLISGFNADYNNKLRIRLFGTTNGTIDFSVPARSSIYKAFATESEQKTFYPAFYPPSNAYGDISCIAH